jgi:NTP pyrophosphatase (non-canonical NTP hydrolase)
MNRFDDIRAWAHARKLIDGSTPDRQFLKLSEEVGELAAGLAKGNRLAVIDGIGDAIVVLTILASQVGVLVEDCIDAAWEEIKDRKGVMLNGVFIKDGD